MGIFGALKGALSSLAAKGRAAVATSGKLAPKPGAKSSQTFKEPKAPEAERPRRKLFETKKAYDKRVDEAEQKLWNQRDAAARAKLSGTARGSAFYSSTKSLWYRPGEKYDVNNDVRNQRIKAALAKQNPELANADMQTIIDKISEGTGYDFNVQPDTGALEQYSSTSAQGNAVATRTQLYIDGVLLS